MCGKTTLEHYEPVWNMLQRTGGDPVNVPDEQHNMSFNSSTWHYTPLLAQDRPRWRKLVGTAMLNWRAGWWWWWWNEIFGHVCSELLRINLDAAVIHVVVTCQLGSSCIVTFLPQLLTVCCYSTVHIPKTPCLVDEGKESENKYECTIDQELAYTSVAKVCSRRFIFTHQVAAFSCVKWRRGCS